ncbi:MAG: chromate transporter, partial [Thermoflexibacteraceae bacterium]
MSFLRTIIFLKDILLLALTAFGGPQAHIGLFIKLLVEKRRYLTEAELLELNALCQMLPGPSSTQTLIAIGYKRGGFWLAFATLLVWICPAVTIMIVLALGTEYMPSNFAKFVPAMAVGFVASAALQIIPKVVQTKMAWVLMSITAVVACAIRSPWELPFIVLLSGLIASFKFYKQEKIEDSQPFNIKWRYLIIFGGIFIGM